MFSKEEMQIFFKILEAFWMAVNWRRVVVIETIKKKKSKAQGSFVKQMSGRVQVEATLIPFIYDKLQNKVFFYEKGQPTSNHDKPRR
jgi:hypothetical protein